MRWMIFLQLFLTHRTCTDPLQPLKYALLMEHVLARKFNNFLIWLKFYITNRTQVWLFVLFVVIHFLELIKLLLVQAGILIWIGATGKHFDQLDKCWGICTVWADNEVGTSIRRKSNDLVSWTTSVLALAFEWIGSKEGMTKKIHQWTGIVHVLISLIKNHGHAVFIVGIKLVLLSSHSVSASLIPLEIDRIFLANLHVVIHQRLWVLILAEITLDFPMLTLTWMSVQFCQGLAIAAEGTGNFLLVFEFGRGFLERAYILFDIHLGKGVRLPDRLLKLKFLFFLFERRFLGITVLRDSAGAEFWHSLAAAFVNEEIWSDDVPSAGVTIGCRFLVVPLHLALL